MNQLENIEAARRNFRKKYSAAAKTMDMSRSFLMSSDNIFNQSRNIDF